MRIAILGAGFAGLSVTWFLLHYTKGAATVDLFDPEPIGKGVSGLSSGLLHPYVGKHAKLAWHAERNLKETHRLITEASQAINHPVILSKGILRLAQEQEQISDFRATALKYDDTKWWSKEECENNVIGVRLPKEGGGLYIKEGLTIDVPTYLNGLWKSCALLGTQYHQKAVIQEKDLVKYDRVLIAMGPLTKNFPPLAKLPITPIKGQSLILKWPEGAPPLPFSINSKKYLVMSPDHKTCIAGATYERDLQHAGADLERATQDILPDIVSYFPPLEGAEILDCRVGFRASTKNHLPLLGKFSEKVFFLTGLGSKGLLFHGLVGKIMAKALLSGDTKYFPSELHAHL